MIVIIVPRGAVPAIIEQDDEAAMLDILRTKNLVPPEIAADGVLSREAVEEWLATLSPPSGWYDTRRAAEAAAASLKTRH